MLKHSKYKNTGILFELLIRQLTSDTLSSKDTSKITNIIQHFFKQGTELYKEYKLYECLTKTHYVNNTEKANELLQNVLDIHNTLNIESLNKQKYKLIKEIKQNCNIDTFVNSKINNYKLFATIYKLFEYKIADSPVEYIDNKDIIIHHIISNPDTIQENFDNQQNSNITEFIKQDKQVRDLAFKFLINKLNTKYKDLNESQSNLLRQYIYSVDSSDFKKYIFECIDKIDNDINVLRTVINDKVTEIKLNEVTNCLRNMKKIKTVKDNDVLIVLEYYELIKELKKIQ